MILALLYSAWLPTGVPRRKTIEDVYVRFRKPAISTLHCGEPQSLGIAAS
jgi:hypothetical protein